jgi:hypothetical protein
VEIVQECDGRKTIGRRCGDSDGVTVFEET